MVTLVDGAVSIFSVAQQRAAKLCHGDADLMGPPRQQTALYQRQLPPGLQSLIESNGALASGDGAAVKGNLLFCLVLEQEALHTPLCRPGSPHSDAEIGFLQLVTLYFFIDGPQRLRIFCGDDNPSGVAVNAVAQRRGKGVTGPFCAAGILSAILLANSSR